METRDPSAITPMETGRPAVIPPHRCEMRGCQETAVVMRTGTEVVGEGGWLGVQDDQGA